MTETSLPAHCRRVRARLAGLLDGTLAALESARDLGHLEACLECAAERSAHERLLSLLRASVPPWVPEDTARVVARVQLELANWPRLRPRRSRTGIALLAAAAAVLLLFWVGDRETSAAAAEGVRSLARVDEVLARLPSWTDLLRGLGQLSKGLS
jgi:anti-sigma factor RsiW